MLHEKVQTCFNDGDVPALVTLYEPNARMMREDGSVAVGEHEIRDVWSGFVALGGRITMVTRYAIEVDDIALLSNTWTFDGAGITLSATTAEVARRQPDGTWRYVIDNPFGGGISETP
jgi:ketosteroid isomerase-like protein